MRRYYVNKDEAENLVNLINKQQHRNKEFFNIAVKSYLGKKYDPENTVVVVVG